MELELAREGGKVLKDKGTKTEGCGSCFQMHVKLNYDHNHDAFSLSNARLAFIAEMKENLTKKNGLKYWPSEA